MAVVSTSALYAMQLGGQFDCSSEFPVEKDFRKDSRNYNYSNPRCSLLKEEPNKKSKKNQH